jgi:hypothetical protein
VDLVDLLSIYSSSFRMFLGKIHQPCGSTFVDYRQIIFTDTNLPSSSSIEIPVKEVVFKTMI